jgi:hypothetical protein
LARAAAGGQDGNDPLRKVRYDQGIGISPPVQEMTLRSTARIDHEAPGECPHIEAEYKRRAVWGCRIRSHY